MHEVSVVTSLVDAVIAELGKYRVEKVNSVTAVIGDLTWARSRWPSPMR